MNSRFSSVFQEIEFLLAEGDRSLASGPNFTIVHSHSHSEGGCWPGEEIAFISYIYRSREFPLRLPATLRILFDYFAQHRHFPQTASQVESGVKADEFYVRHGLSAGTTRKTTRRIRRASIKQYVSRIREALGWVFQEAGVDLEPCNVLLSEATVGKEVFYRLKANVHWVHLR